MKRVWALYRVSSDKQVGVDNDIPLQEKEVRSFIEMRKDWKLERELYELGVSGFKKTLDDRDAIRDIKAAAESGAFDVLIVFLPDRIGRNKDECPPAINYLINKCGIEIWSSQEGQINAKTHEDHLINYIRYWGSEGESIKISKRVTPAIRQLKEEGGFHNGFIAYGYEKYRTGKIHPKYDKVMYDMRPHPEESEIVKIMFNLADEKGYGGDRIASYLNEHGYKTRNGKVWRFNVILRILQNPLYTGCRLYNTVYNGTQTTRPKEDWLLQPFNEKWAIINQAQFDRVQKMIASRGRRKDNQNEVSVAQRGKLLLSGFAYCGYCGEKLHANYGFNTYKKKNGEISKYQTYRYQCQGGRNRKGTHGKHMFAKQKYEGEAEKGVMDFINSLKLDSFKSTLLKGQKKASSNKQRELKKVEEVIKKAENALEKLNDEIILTLTNESVYTKEQLSPIMNKKTEELDELKVKRDQIKKDIDMMEVQSKDVEQLAFELINWKDKYLNGDFETRKVMLSRIIRSVKFYKDSVEIDFKFDPESLGLYGVSISHMESRGV